MSNNSIVIINDAKPFDVFKALLTDKKTYAKFTDKVKKNNFFIVQRMLAKAFPLAINKGNVNGINQIAMLDFYHFKLCQDGGFLPNWSKVKGGNDTNISKEEKLIKEIKSNVSNCLLLLEHLGIELKSLEDLVYQDFVFVESEYKKLLIIIEGKMKKNQKI